MFSCPASTPAPRKFGYPRSYRLTRELDLEQVKKAGRRLRTEHLEVRANDSLLSHARAAVVVGKHGHTIVERNRLRRRLRELVRLKILPAAHGVDIVVRTFPSAYDSSFNDLSREIDDLTAMLKASSRQE